MYGGNSDADGIQDPEEIGVANITVRLYEDSNHDGVVDPALDALVQERATDATGSYLFEGLPAGPYVAVVDLGDLDLPKDGYGKPFVPSTKSAAGFTLSSGQSYLEADFGFAPGAYLGDRIWADSDGDGNQDPGETGIGGVGVELYLDLNHDGVWDAEDLHYGSLTADANGVYSFTGLTNGFYVIKVAQPAGTTQTGDPDASSVPCSGGDCNNQYAVSLKAGQINLFADFGYRPANSLGDFVWLDSDKDGSQDPGEVGIGSVRLWLCSSAPCGAGNALAVTFTDSDGSYRFGGMTAGTYTVTVDPGSLPPDLSSTPTFDPQGSYDGTATLAVEGNVLIADFGYYFDESGMISGTVFFDTLNDGGAFTSGMDIPFSNVTVYLYDNNGKLVATTATNQNGTYVFTNLPSLTFKVVLDLSSPQIAGMALTYEPDVAGDMRCDPTDNCDNKTDVSPTASSQDFGLFATMDCGDLPDNSGYQTSLAKQGPCHIFEQESQHYLGSSRDSDYDGLPDALALGDNIETTSSQDPAGGNDEDGVEPVNFNTSWISNTDQQLNIFVKSGTIYVVGWFDWNNDGDFVVTGPAGGGYDPGEYVNFGWLEEGVNTVNIHLPNGSACCSLGVDSLKARFRAYEGGSTPALISSSGIVSGGEVEDYVWKTKPTSVQMLRFDAEIRINSVLLRWETVNELNAIGFNIFRSPNPGSQGSRLNTELLPSQNSGSLIGMEYSFEDSSTSSGANYYYWIEFVDREGSEWFGPLNVSPSLKLLFMPLIQN